MSDLEKRWDTKLPLSVSMHVLRRSVETAAQTYHRLKCNFEVVASLQHLTRQKPFSRLHTHGKRGNRTLTVDKFQGQEAPIAIYSMATSSHADAPRGMEFLYSANRFNVAISRAKCVMDLSRFSSAPGSHLSCHSLKSQGAFPT